MLGFSVFMAIRLSGSTGFSTGAAAIYLTVSEPKANASVNQIGGAYGGEITCNLHSACACALACFLTQLPVRFVLPVESNAETIGTHVACANKYDVIFDGKTGRIKTLTNFYIHDFGCSLNFN